MRTQTLSIVFALALNACTYGRYEQPADTTVTDPGPSVTLGSPGNGGTVTDPGVTETDPDSDGDGVSDSLDCKPNDANIYPGADDESCDGVDSNCDGVDGLVTARSASECGGTDADGDGYEDLGFNEDGTSYVVDCNDDPNAGGADVNPGMPEVPYDGVDNDCSAATLDDDLDGDGVLLVADCDDTDPAVNPMATEVPDDDVDNDCDPNTPDASVPDENDLDDDGHDSLESGGDDCDDGDATAYPGAPIIFYDDVDNDCDGDVETDQDCDGYEALSDGGTDCDDEEADIRPGVAEVPDDGVDNDCDPNTVDESVVEEEPVDEPEACDGAFSIVTGFFQAPAGSTFVSLYGRRTGPNGELVDDWFNDDISWTDGVNDPTNMIVVYDTDTVVFTLDACVADVGARWTVNGMYTDSFGTNHWICEGSSLTTIDAEVLYDTTPQTISPLSWGGGCDAIWEQ